MIMGIRILKNALYMVTVISVFSACEGQTDTQVTILINEFLTSNDSIYTDEEGEYDDYIELYNAGEEAVDMEGYALTDDLSELDKFMITDSTIIQPGGYLLFWADNDPEQGDMHCNFKLSAGGEEIALLDADGTLIDEVSYGAQSSDVSYGRSPDGSDTWAYFGKCESCLSSSQPSPGASNSQ